jgi:hypothetical protein
MNLCRRSSPTLPIKTWALAFALALAFAPGAARAQVQAQQNQPGDQEAEPARTFAIDFPGGTLIDFVRAVQKAAGGVNVVTSPGADQIRLGPASLKNVSVRTALEASRSLVVDAENESVSTNMLAKGAGEPVYLVNYSKRKDARGVYPDEADLRVYSLEGIDAGGMKVESVLSAVDTAVGLVGGSPKAVIKYHSDSHLLLVWANRAQMVAVDQVISALRPASRAQQQGDEIARLQAELKSANDQIKSLQAAIAELQGKGTKESKDKGAK